MPTDAFFKLDDNKKEQIVKAAVNEFSQLPYAKVSVFKIAQQAGISRSGFSYYFKDKKDVYEFLLDGIKNEFIKSCQFDPYTPMDLFGFSENIFNFISGIKGTDRESFFRMLITDITPEYIKGLFNDEIWHQNCCQCGIELDLSEIEHTYQNDLKGIIFLLANSIVYSLIGYFNDEETLEEGKNKLNMMFDIIRHGIIKGE